MSKSNQKNRGIFSPMSEHEGQTVYSGGKLFAIEDGRRVWLEEPPADVLPDLLAYAPVRRVEPRVGA